MNRYPPAPTRKRDRNILDDAPSDLESQDPALQRQYQRSEPHHDEEMQSRVKDVVRYALFQMTRQPQPLSQLRTPSTSKSASPSSINGRHVCCPCPGCAL
ncbi:hypothetical protein H696_00142 [Fonticula alba]|uniref:Uncharacterized protein n=1 Tax=Fonticula alba TaxID=691883 RepID=A0A058ZF24_FONAL|nr:hypothetical protein H696_00142 [Fonticula alba]KCV72551.1 hypothetical protein H696_00142 [Fonticula alba]|eukprot:XP_009492252.1 hypothetical protein H696_00142 [Fonticula alba]